MSQQIGSAPGVVLPLGTFGVLATEADMLQIRDELRASGGAIETSERGSIANYLRQGAVVIALMEHTRDAIGGQFGVPGGSAIHTDGEFYWRRDAADYVEHYGVALPPEFLRRGRERGWAPLPVAKEQVLAIDDYLAVNIRRPKR